MPIPMHGGRKSVSFCPAVRLLACSSMLALAACANRPHLMLYDDARAKQSATARDDWKAVDLAGVISAQQANLKTLLAAETKAEADAATLQAQLELTALVDKPLFDTWNMKATPEPQPQVEAGSLPAGLGSRIGARFLKLVGTPYESASVPNVGAPGQPQDVSRLLLVYKSASDPVTEELRAISNAKLYSDSFKGILKKFGLAVLPTCNDVPPTPNTFSPTIQAVLDNPATHDPAGLRTYLEPLRTKCAQIKKLSDADKVRPYGEHGLAASARKEYDAAKKESDDAQADETAAEKAYEDAKADYEQMVKDAGSNTPAADLLTAKAAAVQAALKQLDDLSGKTHGLSDVFVSKERLALYSGYLDDLQEGLAPSTTTLKDETPKSAAVAASAAPAAAPAASAASATTTSEPHAVAALVAVTRLIDDFHDYAHANEVAKQLPLQLMAEQERLKLQAAQAVTAERTTQLALLAQIVTNLDTQVDQLALALANVQAASALGQHLVLGKTTDLTQCDLNEPLVADWRARPFGQTFCTTTPKTKYLLLQAAVGYYDIVQRQDAQYYQLQYTRLDAMDREMLAIDDANLLRWQALVNPTVNGLADYYASGISAQTFASLVSAASLVWVGHGVNK